MPYYTIRHKPSGAYFPIFKGGQRRGSTYIDLPFVGTPRLFNNFQGARHCLRWWLAGEAVPEYDRDDFGQPESMIGASLGTGKEGRVAADMEIVQVILIPIGGSPCSTQSSRQTSKSTSSTLQLTPTTT